MVVLPFFAEAGLSLPGGPTVAWQADHPLGATEGSWAFVLREGESSGNTRLVCRARWRRRESPLHRLGHRGFLEAAHSLMQRKMLLGIKARAERSMQLPEAPEKLLTRERIPHNPCLNSWSAVPNQHPRSGQFSSLTGH